MALTFFPEPGMILVCDFSGYVAPEMIKTRPVVVISPRRHDVSLPAATSIIVPISTKPPLPQRPWQYRISGGKYRGIPECWAKADLVAHVSIQRLDRLRVASEYVLQSLDQADLAGVRLALRFATGT